MNNFSLDVSHAGADTGGLSYTSWARGCLLGIPMSTPHEEETHYNIPYSESMNKNFTAEGLELSGATIVGDGGNAIISIPMSMEGRFTIDETTKVISRIFISVYGSSNDLWTWGAGENYFELKNIGSYGSPSYTYPQNFSGLDSNVMAYIKITKVQ